MSSIRKVLIIDDEENMRHLLSVLLQRNGFQAVLAQDGRQGLQALSRTEFVCVLCDVRMPEMDGLRFLAELRAQSIAVPIVMMSAFGTIKLAVQAMREGACDFITKPFQGEEVIIALEKAIDQQRLRRENEQLRRQLLEISGGNGFDRLVGRSSALRRVVEQAGKIAQYKTTVLITGESGTGKELLAQGIHEASGRSSGSFVAVNCGCIPENLMESEFFGYCKGAFTGADRDKQGFFQEAGGGTLFLDEIGEMPLFMQVKLLRVLQEGEIRPVGGVRPVPTDVRIVAATARDLEEEVKRGTFRQDLFFRLNVLNLRLPPLRERLEDIPLLAEYFLEQVNHHAGTSVKGIARQALRLLMQYHWPGNVRELENIIERGALLAEKDILLAEDLPENFGVRCENRRLDDLLGTLSIKKGRKILEKRLIQRALEATGGNKSKASELLEISYPSLLHKIKAYGI
ncbi:MAG TPA: sigma-54-dependent Fis family transcriptional regulator [Desulfobulbus sp.]|nr:sigma-54-dependent Fis family transcriptional regulator [Desulfobulbus sp.]